MFPVKYELGVISQKTEFLLITSSSDEIPGLCEKPTEVLFDVEVTSKPNPIHDQSAGNLPKKSLYESLQSASATSTNGASFQPIVFLLYKGLPLNCLQQASR
jgi:hypothetical protein